MEDVSLTFQIYNGYTGLNTHHTLLMRYTHDGYYLGMLNETNNHAI